MERVWSLSQGRALEVDLELILTGATKSRVSVQRLLTVFSRLLKVWVVACNITVASLSYCIYTLLHFLQDTEA